MRTARVGFVVLCLSLLMTIAGGVARGQGTNGPTVKSVEVTPATTDR